MLLDAFGTTPEARAGATPAGAYANCYALSVAFARWLHERNVRCQILHLVGSRKPLPDAVGRWALCDPATAQHWAVRVGRWTVDWTARQFSPQADFPCVKSRRRLEREWLLIDKWACAGCITTADERHLALASPALYEEHYSAATSTAGAGPFPDSRHDLTAPLLKTCAHQRYRKALPQKLTPSSPIAMITEMAAVITAPFEESTDSPSVLNAPA